MNTGAENSAVEACAARVGAGDPDRHLAVMAAPPEARAPLFVLYAFNLELARASWVTREPLIARMRLQFWRDVVDEPEIARAHEVAAPLAGLIIRRDLPRALLHRMIDAHEAGSEPDGLADEAAIRAYVEGTAGALMALAVRALGGGANDIAHDWGAAQGMANYLMAVPALRAAGRRPLSDDAPATVEILAGGALIRLEQARMRRAEIDRAARPALLAAWRARAILAQAARHPERVSSGALGQSEFSRRASLLWRALIGP